MAAEMASLLNIDTINSTEMKSRLHTYLFLSALALLMFLPDAHVKGQAKVYGTSGDDVNCGVYISTYREFYKLDLYQEALEPWKVLFNNCPKASEQMYVDGVNIYRSFIEEAPEGPAKERLIDTLMLIYDRRLENFGGEGNILGRKGRDLLEYRRSDIGQVEQAYGMLKKSFELEQEEAQDAVMLLLISSGITLFQEGRLEGEEVLSDYIEVSNVLEQLIDKSSRWKRANDAIQDMVRQENILTCENLNSYFGPRFEDQKDNRDFLVQMTGLYKASGCDRSDMFVSASEQLYTIDPGPISAHNLALVFITRNEFEKAAEYLKMAVVGKDIENDTRAEWFYELALISSANDDHCDAIEYAREAIGLKEDYGKAYILLGDAFIASRENLGDDFEQRTAFWAAADKYAEAARVDPSVMEEARQKRAEYSALFPDKEDIFFRDLNEGDPYRVGGCINEQTTVQF